MNKINHASSPNARIVRFVNQDIVRFSIETKRKIKKKEFLSISYNNKNHLSSFVIKKRSGPLRSKAGRAFSTLSLKLCVCELSLAVF